MPRARREATLLGPASLVIGRDRVRFDETWQRTFAVVGYPREVGYGWLEPLLRAAGEVDVALHVEPIPPAVAADRLRRQRARLESTQRLERERGRLADPSVAAAAEDADILASRIARGESRLLRSGLYLSVQAESEEQLDARCERVRALCSSLLLQTVPTTFRMAEGWVSTLPLGSDLLALRRSFDTDALAASFPFSAVDPPVSGGVMYGLTDSGAPVVVDRFEQDNYNSVLIARSGAGKSYLAKLEALRLLYRGVQVFVIDPEEEYRRLCEAVGGRYVALAGPDGGGFNPLEIAGESDVDPIAQRIVFVARLLELLVGKLDGSQLAAIERATRACYAGAGITADVATHGNPPPSLAQLAEALAEHQKRGSTLAERLAPYATGSHSRLFAPGESARGSADFVCYSLRGLPERLEPPALFLCLDAIWRSLDGPPRRRCVLVDEAWLLMREPVGAHFLFRLAKSARKRWCGLTTVTQDAGDLLSSELGQAVVSNAATQLLLRQAPQALDRVGDAFHLSDGERRHLLTCAPGQGLLLVGEERTPLRVVASASEHALVTTNPAELAAGA
jgi:type IV secretory pathway VirB4 component